MFESEESKDGPPQPHYRCPNAECRAFETVLEDDEVVYDDTSGRRTCCYCGCEVREVTAST